MREKIGIKKMGERARKRKRRKIKDTKFKTRDGRKSNFI